MLLFIALLLRRFKKTIAAKFFFVFAVFFFLLTSTRYLPEFIGNRLERNFASPGNVTFKKFTGKTYIHILGSGYTPNDNFPANAQMGLIALGRMTEALRIYRLLDSAVIITSGNAVIEKVKTQAEVLKEALAGSGVAADRVETLNTPSTTVEEAADLAKKYGTAIQLVIVTDAIHMPRAMRIFKRTGFSNIVAAPANFKTIDIENKTDYWGWVPSVGNMDLSNRILHECLSAVKAAF
ncbi:MAG: YdcF family protein [Ferruginibacter sp.]